MISAVAPSAMARAITSRTWTDASSTEPCHSASLAISMFLALRNRIAHFLDPRVRHGGVEVIAERIPARQHRPAFDPRLEQAQRGRLRDLERGDRRIGQALAPQRVGACRQQRADPAEIVEQPLGQRLGVDPRDGQREQIFDQLIIVETRRAGIEQPLAQARAVAARGVGFIGIAGAPVHAAPSARRARAAATVDHSAAERASAVMPRLERSCAAWVSRAHGGAAER